MSYEFFENEDYDIDLMAAIYNNSDGNNHITDVITNIYAVIEGKNDEDDWHWLVGLKSGKFAYITGGCDYTGWDCRSNITIREFDKDQQIVVPLIDNCNKSPAKEFKSAIELINFIRGY